MLALQPLLITSVCLYVLHILYRRQQRISIPLPPGPKGWPLIGNLFDFPKSHLWTNFAEWAKIYGSDIIHLNVVGQHIIVLNSFTIAEDLLEHRSSIYSGRPQSAMVELMGWDFTFIFKDYGPMWRKHRKLMYQSFNKTAVTKYYAQMTKPVHTLMRNLLEKPEEYRHFVQYMTADIILLLTYGIQIQSKDDPHVELVETATRMVAENAVPGRWLVDVIPWLKHIPDWMPFATFKRVAKQCRKYAIEMTEVPYQAVKGDILAGKDIESLVADGLRTEVAKGDFAEWEEVIKHVAATAYAAGSDTTIVTMMNGILALTCHPEALKKAQAEIDKVVQPGQLPQFSDRESLPYLSALLKEIMRWGPVAPMAIPHLIEQQDFYNGFQIPANTIVLPNVWGMLQDETIYPEPSSFNPERFLKDGKLNPDVRDPETCLFGFGRRICPGKDFAILSTWMTFACLITLFDISKAVDEDGNVIEPRLEWSSSVVSEPLPFKCRITPRSEHAVAAIQRTKDYEY